MLIFIILSKHVTCKKYIIAVAGAGFDFGGSRKSLKVLKSFISWFWLYFNKKYNYNERRAKRAKEN